MRLFTAQSSTVHGLELMNVFFQADGYTIFAKTVGSIGKTGTREQQRQIILAYCHLLFIRQDDESLGIFHFIYLLLLLAKYMHLIEPMVYTINFFNKFLSLFADLQSSEFRASLLCALCEIILVNLHRSEELMDLGVFQMLFTVFDSLSTHLRKLVLRILKKVISVTAASKHAGLLESELPYLVGLLKGNPH